MQILVINAVPGPGAEAVEAVCRNTCIGLREGVYLCETDRVDIDALLVELSRLESELATGALWFVPLCDDCRRNVRRIGWHGSGEEGNDAVTG